MCRSWYIPFSQESNDCASLHLITSAVSASFNLSVFMNRLFSNSRHYTTTFQLHPHILKKYGNSPSNDSQIINLCRTGSLFEALNILNQSNSTTLHSKSLVYASLIQTSIKFDSFRHGIQLHAHVVKNGLEDDCFVGNSLLTLYFKLGCEFSETGIVFDELGYRDVVSWTMMITGCVREGKLVKSIEVFKEMLGCGYIQPNAVTLSAVIKACAEIESGIGLGKCLHGVMEKYGFGSDSVVLSSLIDMYGRNGVYLDARMVFDEMSEPDASSWTCLISAFSKSGLYDRALQLFYRMQRVYGLCPDVFIFGPVLTACGNLGSVKQGKQMHAKAIIFGICENVIVQSSLVDMYGKCGLVDQARQVFDYMEQHNSVTWGALLGGYCLNGDFKSVFDLSRVMGTLHLYSCGTILRACTGLAALRQGKEVHCQYVRKGNVNDVVIETALVEMYAKCGHIERAERLFSLMTSKSIRTWNSMIFGYAQNGRAEESLELFDKMIAEGIEPNSFSFIGVLFACTHTGLLEKGKEYFKAMKEEYGIQPEVQHYSCIIDLLGRAGFLAEAETLLMSSEFKTDVSIWAVLLGSACTTGTNSDTALRIADRMMELNPGNHLSYVYLANVYSATGHWNKASNIIEMMKLKRINKSRGRSWIDTDHCIVNYAQPAAQQFLNNEQIQ